MQSPHLTMPPLLALQALGTSLPAEAVRLFSRHAVKKGATLLRAGDRWDKAFAVEAGALRMFFVSKDGAEFNKSFHLEHSLLLPITEEMQSQASLFEIACVEASVIWTAPAAPLIHALQEHEIWQSLQTHLLSQLLMGKLAREHDLLTLDAKTRYLKVCAEQPALVQRIPLSLLATYLGITDVSLSRIRRELQRV